MATLKKLADFIDITESGMKYKKKYKPSEFKLIELGYYYLQNLPEFERGSIIVALKAKETKVLKEKAKKKAKSKKEEGI